MPRQDLPIFELESAIVAELGKTPRLILQAPTGSGKSTQVPQILLDRGLLGDGEVVVLQPRRLATRMLAARVAQERGVRLGDEVGYQIRFDRVVSERTRIRFVTEGVLLRQMLGDPGLRGVSAILFDEFHERHLYGDITLARALELQEKQRPDLKIVVMSATLDTGRLEKYLAPCATLTSQGRMHPVWMEYLDKPAGDYPVWNLAADELERLVREGREGDALVFMPGAYEINRTVQAVRASSIDCVVMPLHGELPPADQDAAMARYEKRKVVVSTNVAETSLTIDGVRIVIDCGLAKIARFDPYRGINTLLVEKISRASAEQRAGRAGRTAPGMCLRLWTEREHEARAPQELPEIKRLDLAEIVLTLKASGVEDVKNFRWLEPPDPRSLERAETLLEDLGALQTEHRTSNAEHPTSKENAAHETKPFDVRCSSISPLGRRMLAFPVHPRYARMLLAAHDLGCVPAAARVAALTQGRSVLRRAEGKQMAQEREDILGEKAESDFFILLRALRFAEQNNFNPQRCQQLGIHAGAAREAAQLTEQFLKIARDEKLGAEAKGEPNDESIRRCVLAGFPDHVAMRLDAGTLRCQLVHGRRGVLARESVVQHAPLLVVTEVREISTKDGPTTLLTLASAIEENWLRELFPGGFRETADVFFDTTQRRVIARREIVFRDLVLRSEQSEKVAPELAAPLLAAQVVAGACPLKTWDAAVEQWIVRVNRLREWMPELEISAIAGADRVALIEQVCYGATTYKEIKERPVWPTVKSWLSAQQQAWLDQFTPERFDLPNGRRAKITYAESGPPVIAARIQDLYGVSEDLRIADRRISLTIQVLAPNQRPVQITTNLATFWKESYPKLKLELARKYPRHEWR